MTMLFNLGFESAPASCKRLIAGNLERQGRLEMRKPLVERIYDKYAPGYSKGALEALSRFRARTAMSFGDDISW